VPRLCTDASRFARESLHLRAIDDDFLVAASAIQKVRAREILDSRGRPTVEVEVTLSGGQVGAASVPAGASRGRHEAFELRDGDVGRYRGLGVRRAVANVNDVIAPLITGRDAADQAGLDGALIDADGTSDKSKFGANALLAVSLAVTRAAASAAGLPLWRYIGDDGARVLPLPMINLVSGGLHAGGSVDVQDFLIVPVGATTFRQALEMSAEVYAAAADLIAERGLSTLKADEGGFAPALESNEAALELVVAAIERGGYTPGEDVSVAVDVAASHFFDPEAERYRLDADKRTLDAAGLIELLESWVAAYPIVSLEDILAEDDWASWTALADRLTANVQILGDDLFATNAKRLERGIENSVANAVLVKMNQVGTLTETLALIEQARRAGYKSVISARSGETEDAFIADLAVATNAGQIKIGSLAQSERLAKYNQLLRIEEAFGDDAIFLGRDALAR
jgi:enolase